MILEPNIIDLFLVVLCIHFYIISINLFKNFSSFVYLAITLMKNKRSRKACFIISTAEIMEKSIDYGILLNIPPPDSPSQNDTVSVKICP